MKKFIITLMCFTVFLTFSNLSQSHEIHLKDGRVIEAESVWDEDNKIMYEKFDTVVSIEKDLVKKIEYDEVLEETPETRAKKKEEQQSRDKAEAKRYAELGCQYFSEKQYHEAREMFAAALKANPNEPGYYASLGLCWDLIGGRYLFAQSVYRKGLEKFPNHPLIMKNKRISDEAERRRDLKGRAMMHNMNPGKSTIWIAPHFEPIEITRENLFCE